MFIHPEQHREQQHSLGSSKPQTRVSNSGINYFLQLSENTSDQVEQ